MPRNLTLVRHAKSSWDDTGLQDFERPLNKRGHKNAPMMGKRLAACGFQVDTIISSPAVRALTTASMLATEISFDPDKILRNHSMYAAGLGTLLEVVTSIDDRYRHAMLVGHNPGFTLLCNHLCGDRIDNMPTCSIARLEFDTDTWKAVARQKGRMTDFDYPRKE